MEANVNHEKKCPMTTKTVGSSLMSPGIVILVHVLRKVAQHTNTPFLVHLSAVVRNLGLTNYWVSMLRA